MDRKLSKELDVIIESKIGDVWRDLPPEAKAGIVTGIIIGGVPVAISAVVSGVNAFFKLFKEKCKRQCDALRGEKQYNLCYYSCKRNGIKQCIIKLQSIKTKCKNDKCKQKINQQLATWKNKLSELEQLIKKI